MTASKRPAPKRRRPTSISAGSAGPLADSRRPPLGARAPRPHRFGVAVEFGMFKPTARIDPRLRGRMIRRLVELGVDHVRYELPMRETLEIALEPDHFAVDNVRALRAAGIDVIAVVGVGNRRALPDDLSVDDPDYVAKVSANVRDIATRLAPLGVRHYQIENELNVAGQSALPLIGWRRGARWWDGAFKRELLAGLRAAVKGAAPDAVVTTNIFDHWSEPADMRAGKSARLTALRGLFFTIRDGLLHRERRDRWLHAVSPLVDEIGLDLYPNYLLPRAVTSKLGASKPNPIAGGFLGVKRPGAFIADRARHYGATTGKPVRVAETGYPAARLFGADPRGQAEFAAEVVPALTAADIPVTWFRLYDPVVEHRTGPLAWLKDFNASTEPYFGLLDTALAPKPGAGSRTSAFSAIRDLLKGAGPGSGR